MGISQKDIKLLWGRSGNRCAICRSEITQDKKSVTASFNLGEQAHIVGEKEESARGKSILSKDERNGYHNLILLCPTHHTEIDENEEDYPVEKLHKLKSAHELWVMETLSATVDIYKIANQIAMTSVIDSVVQYSDLENWKNWTSFSLSNDPSWPTKFGDHAFDLLVKVKSTIWPNEYGELKCATITFSKLFIEAFNQFRKHARRQGDTYYPDKFYSASTWNNNYDSDLKKYEEWIIESHKALREAAKAANWFCDILRRDINPMFFIELGRITVIEDTNNGFQPFILEFTKEQKTSYIDEINV